MGAAGCDLLEEELAVVALAAEASVVIGERDDDRVDLVGLDETSQLVEREHGPRYSDGTAWCESIMSAITWRMNSSASAVMPPMTLP